MRGGIKNIRREIHKVRVIRESLKESNANRYLISYQDKLWFSIRIVDTIINLRLIKRSGILLEVNKRRLKEIRVIIIKRLFFQREFDLP